VDRKNHSEIDKQWLKSARQRLDEIRSGKVKPVPGKQVFEKIWQTFDDTEKEIDELWAQEVEDRIDAYDRGEIESVSVEEVLGKYFR
jgi:putative addiction module component (TIGR02574 family)